MRGDWCYHKRRWVLVVQVEERSTRRLDKKVKSERENKQRKLERAVYIYKKIRKRKNLINGKVLTGFCREENGATDFCVVLLQEESSVISRRC